MSEFKEFKFISVYSLADLVEIAVMNNHHNFANEQMFINSAVNFNKNTLLHQYIEDTALQTYYFEFRECEIDESELEHWYYLFKAYKIKIPKAKEFSSKKLYEWYDSNSDKYSQLFSYLAQEVFYILFANRNFLEQFNNCIVNKIIDTTFPGEFLTNKKTIKRKTIPVWVKDAVFHRDKGHCVFCNTKIDKTVDLLTKSNFDHIVPLDLYGTNDPSNIQLCCERCNKKKSNKNSKTGKKYMTWW